MLVLLARGVAPSGEMPSTAIAISRARSRLSTLEMRLERASMIVSRTLATTLESCASVVSIVLLIDRQKVEKSLSKNCRSNTTSAPFMTKVFSCHNF